LISIMVITILEKLKDNFLMGKDTFVAKHSELMMDHGKMVWNMDMGKVKILMESSMKANSEMI
jgi:hypothetical protein